MTAVPPLLIGDARIDRVADQDRFTLPLRTLFPTALPEALAAERHWLEPGFMQADEVHLAMHSLVLRVAGLVVLIDSCVGEHKQRPRQPPWHDRRDTGYLGRLAALGLQPEDVDIVFCTHLHADHVGWNTQLVDGRWIPTWPKARYLIGHSELAHWEAQTARNPSLNHGSYADSILPVLAAGQVDLVERDHEVRDGLVVRPLPGHSPGQVGLALERRGERGLFVGDAIHHPVQLVRPDWSSAFCSDPSMAIDTRRALLAAAAATGSWLLPAHFMGMTGCKISTAGDGFRLAGG